MRRPYNHLSIRYLYHRIFQIAGRWRQPQAPWLSSDAIDFLDQWLQITDTVVEWGSGKSTAWFAQRVSSMISIEHQPAWYEIVSSRLNMLGLTNVEYHLVDWENCNNKEDSYCTSIIENVVDNSVDFILVDGKMRDLCALSALKKLSPGGVLCIDDAHLYLPSKSKSPSAIPIGGTISGRWPIFIESVREWRHIWFSDGVHDDAIFIKPC